MSDDQVTTIECASASGVSPGLEQINITLIMDLFGDEILEAMDRGIQEVESHVATGKSYTSGSVTLEIEVHAVHIKETDTPGAMFSFVVKTSAAKKRTSRIKRLLRGAIRCGRILVNRNSHEIPDQTTVFDIPGVMDGKS